MNKKRLFGTFCLLAAMAMSVSDVSAAGKVGPATYEGRNADASWRAGATARIERIRKAPLKVQVVDAQGKPINGAKVHLQQKRHAFGFGNILNPTTFQLEGESGRIYRRIFAEHFNKTTFESGFRWHNWYLPARQGRLNEHKRLLESMTSPYAVITSPGRRLPAITTNRLTTERIRTSSGRSFRRISMRCLPSLMEASPSGTS